MAIEKAGTHAVRKPWGSPDLRPWSPARDNEGTIGELWFERAAAAAPDPSLRLKLLFTTAPLSIQVHPDDAFARSIGLAHGKTEAWYILAAAPGAAVALGLRRPLTATQLRAAIEDGSIADQVDWRPVRADDVILVPAGTIHALGAGLVVAEIQQRSDTTFRLYDHGRPRALHPDQGVAAARAGPADRQTGPVRLSDARSLLVADPHFILERIALAPGATWDIDARRETWMLVVAGHARIGALDAIVGEAVFLDGACARLTAGSIGLTSLLAYPGPDPDPALLRAPGGQAGADRAPAAPVPA